MAARGGGEGDGGDAAGGSGGGNSKGSPTQVRVRGTKPKRGSKHALTHTPLFRRAVESELTDFTLVGAGQFGTVYRAFWHGNCPTHAVSPPRTPSVPYAIPGTPTTPIDVGTGAGAFGGVFGAPTAGHSGTSPARRRGPPPGSPSLSSLETPTAAAAGSSAASTSTSTLSISAASLSSLSSLACTGSAATATARASPPASLGSHASHCPAGCPSQLCGAIQVAVKKTAFNQEEAQLLALVSHRHVVKMFAACTDGPNCFIVTEFLAGGSLHEVLETRENITADYKLLWISQLAKGMAYLHHDCPRRIIHRDLKSPNAVLTELLDVLKICDFGCSDAVSMSMSGANLSGFVGTPNWMAPEAIRPDSAVPLTEKCDVWSFAVCVWEIMTQESPFDGLNKFQVILTLGRFDGKSDPLLIPSTAPGLIQSLLRECWELQPHDRPSFEDIVDALNTADCNAEIQAQIDQLTDSKGGWRDHLDPGAVQEVKQIADKLAEIEIREARLTEREQALQLYLRSRARATDDAPGSSSSGGGVGGGGDGNGFDLRSLSGGFGGETSALWSAQGSKPVTTIRERPHQLTAWSKSEVQAWVSVLPAGLGVYERQFRENHIDGSIMATLTDLVLKDGIGVASYGHRVGLLWQISKARQESSFPALSSKRRLAGKQSTNINMLLTFDVADGGNECWSINAKLTGEAGLNRVDQYVNRIEFTITTEDSSAPVTVMADSPPFEAKGRYDLNRGWTGKITVIAKTSYTPHFKRKTTLVHLKDIDTKRRQTKTQTVTLCLKKSAAV